MIYKAGCKNGKLANGMELGKGKIIHAVKGFKSLCGQEPKISWSEREIKDINCKKCLKIIKELEGK